jgi:sodium-dependent dicarboxylate transporter 2/3/5
MTWKGLSEIASNLTEAEVRFEKQRRLFGLVVGPLAFLICLLAPALPQTSDLGMRTLGIFLWTVIWWVCEPIPIPITSFLGTALLVLAGVTDVGPAFAGWSNWINIFLLGACIIGHAMSVHGLTKRIAYKMVALPIVGGQPWRILLLFGIGSAVMSSMMSHVVTTMIFISIATGLGDAFDFKKDPRYAECLFLAIAWGSNLGIATPVGTPPNLMAIGFAERIGYRIGFLEWIQATLPVFIVSLIAVFLVIKYFLRPAMPKWNQSQEFLESEFRKLGPMRPGEKIVAIVFITAMFLWMLPDLVPLAINGLSQVGLMNAVGAEHPLSIWLKAHLDWSVSAIIMATSLFLIPLDWKNWEFTMTWEQAVKGVEWGTLSLIAAALSLGAAIASTEIGLGAFLQSTITSFAEAGGSEFLFVLLVVTFTIVVGAFISNIAIMGMVGALLIAIAPTAAFNPIAMVVAAGMAASFDFALPIGTPPSAMVFASGYVRIGTMFKGGSILALFGVAIVSLLGYYTVAWTIPWPIAP